MPEQMDLKITDYCDAGCPQCHESSTVRGKHGSVDRVLELLRPLNPGTEIAVGGGDPLSHPEFSRFMRGLRDMGLIGSVTVNGRHLERWLPVLRELTEEKALRGVGVSYSGFLPDWDYPHMVMHMIAGVDSPRVLEGSPPRKVLVLGYKTHGRGESLYRKQGDIIRERRMEWYRDLPWLAQEHHLSFDNLAIEQLKPARLFRNPEDYRKRYMGEEGCFSMYVDAVTETYGLSSYSKERNPWSDIAGMFKQVRETAFAACSLPPASC